MMPELYGVVVGFYLAIWLVFVCTHVVFGGPQRCIVDLMIAVGCVAWPIYMLMPSRSNRP